MTDDARTVPLLLGLLFGLTGLGSAAAAVVLPLLGQDLGIDVGHASWTISLYALMLAVATPVYGRVRPRGGSDSASGRGVLMSLGALLAAAAPSAAVLLAARVLQGAGAAAMPTLTVAAVIHRYGGAVRGLALGWLAGVTAALSSVGALVGGVVAHAAGWRAVLALPILGLLVVPFVWRALTGEGTGATLDILGAVLVAATAAGLVLLVQSPSSGGVVALVGLLLLVLGVPAVAAYVRRRPHGFLPRSVAGNPTVVRSAVAAATIPAAWFGLLIAIPAILVGEGWQVGLLLVPPAVLSLVVPRHAGRLLHRLGPARALAVAATLSGAGLLLAALATARVSPIPIMFAVACVTTAYGLGQPAMTEAVSGAVPVEVRGVALGIAAMVFMVGASVGSAAVGGIGEVIGIPLALAVLAALPALALLVLSPSLERNPPVTDLDPREVPSG